MARSDITGVCPIPTRLGIPLAQWANGWSATRTYHPLVIDMYDPATGDWLPTTGPVDEFNCIYLTEVEIRTLP
jgi:hypothetical protein